MPYVVQQNDPKLDDRKRKADLKDPSFAHIPKKPTSQGPGTRLNQSFFFTQYVMKDKIVDNSRMEDPREALLKYDQITKTDPKYLGKAYAKTQPKQVMHHQTFEAEQAEFKKNLKTFK